MAGPTAILDPQITLNSVDGDEVVLNASPEWKKKLAYFLKYAETTDDRTVDCHVDLDVLADIRTVIGKQSRIPDKLKLNKLELLDIGSAVAVFSDYPSCGFYDYNADDYNRLHDDFLDIKEVVFNRKSLLSRRVRTELSGKFDG
ncbi:MAG: hypothetical protein ACRBB3_09060 [Alphaproteobacteria bacterium]